MAEKGREKAQPAGPAKAEEKAPPPKPDLIRDLWKEQTRLKLHLPDGTVLAGRIKEFDRFNLQVLTDDDRLYLIPKHALVYAEVL